MALRSLQGKNDLPVDSASQTASLQPRYRRLLSFGAVLDESMLLFRRHWISFALVSAVSLLPPGLLLVWLSGAGFISRSFSLAELESGRLADPAAANDQLVAQLAALVLYLVVYSFFGLLWTGAIVVTTNAYLRGEPPKLARVYGRSVRRYFTVLVSTVLFTLGLIGLALAATALFVVTVFGLVGSLIAIVGLLFWWLRPTTRRRWLKWLIILTAPFGLPTYVATQWALYLAAAVLEDKGPVAALSRSYELTDRHWFRVVAILWVASTIVGVMLSVLNAFVSVPFMVFEAFRGQFGLSPSEAVISGAVSSVARILLASIGSIVYTLLFIDLRNRREGTDIVERVSQLEAAALPASG
jgi:hypothetical protein